VGHQQNVGLTWKTRDVPDALVVPSAELGRADLVLDPRHTRAGWPGTRETTPWLHCDPLATKVAAVLLERRDDAVRHDDAV